jgi:hypothetical protein
VTCDGCGQPIPKTAKFASSTVTGTQVALLREHGRLVSEPQPVTEDLYSLTLCLACRIELSKISKGL